jgi:hypothetical protein
MAFSVVRLAARGGKRAGQLTLDDRRVKKTSSGWSGQATPKRAAFDVVDPPGRI